MTTYFTKSFIDGTKVPSDRYLHCFIDSVVVNIIIEISDYIIITSCLAAVGRCPAASDK